MGGYVVYVDQVLAGNLLLNYLLLRVAGRLSQVKVPLYRLWLSSILGSIYSLLLFVPGYQLFFVFPAKVFVSVLMVTLAFAPLPLPRFLSCLAFFYLCSFALGGIWLGLIYFLYANPQILNDTNLLGLINRYFWVGFFLALATLMGGGRIILLLWQYRWRSQAYQVGLAVEVEGRRVDLEAMVDTGNSLRDPLSGYPVIVVDHAALQPLWPPFIQRLFAQGIKDETSLMLGLAQTSWSTRFRLVPYRSLGLEHGTLLGFRPDLVEIQHNGQCHQFHEVILGIYGRVLGNCQALVPPDLVSN